MTLNVHPSIKLSFIRLSDATKKKNNGCQKKFYNDALSKRAQIIPLQVLVVDIIYNQQQKQTGILGTFVTTTTTKTMMKYCCPIEQHKQQML
jgi:hypothetical protein